MSLSVTSITSPKTGKLIKVGGPAYSLLLKDPNWAAKAKRAKRVEVPAPETHQRQKGPTTPPKSVNLPKAKTGRAQGRGSRTRGWGDAAPQRGKEREELKKKCGDKCFLKPNSNGFPICAAPRTKEGCAVDCRGIIAAKVRAGQWKYEDVRKAADELSKKYGCV